MNVYYIVNIQNYVIIISEIVKYLCDFIFFYSYVFVE